MSAGISCQIIHEYQSKYKTQEQGTISGTFRTDTLTTKFQLVVWTLQLAAIKLLERFYVLTSDVAETLRFPITFSTCSHFCPNQHKASGTYMLPSASNTYMVTNFNNVN